MSFPAPTPRLAGDIRLCLFLKAPRPGFCKTRLARRCGPRRAAALYRAMAWTTAARACRLAPGRVELWCAPDGTDPFFAHMQRRFPCSLHRQRRGTLGVRMHHTVSSALTRAPRVVLIGGDQPGPIKAPLQHAAVWLSADYPAWLAPATDGGYWAIGLVRCAGGLFRGPAWSTPRVVRHTRTILRRQGWAWREWPACRDVDTPRDWYRLSRPLRRDIARRAALPGLPAADR